MSNGNGNPASGAMTVYLLSIRGALSSPTLEAARAIHNATAGAPANVAAARSLGDLSHMVYVPTGASPTNEFLILDLWNSMDGLNQFFANPHVQEQAGQIFASRDPVVWAPAEGFLGYHFPAPHGKNDRIVAVVRGPVASRVQALAAHNAIVAGGMNQARQAGDLSHDAYFRLAPPGSPEALEFMAVDVWMDAQGMAAFYGSPEFQQAAQTLFAGQPSATTWIHPPGDWVEW
jgi:quinol monooxygenase YgiN